jgi:NADH-quinone oxidoreductase subunit C
MSEDVVRALVSRFGDFLRDVVSEKGRVTFTAAREISHEVLAALNTMGFDHLSDVMGVDYPADGEFEVVYHLWSHARKARLIQKVRVPRDLPLLESAVDLWPGAQIHEREAHELFGIGFEGNPDLSPLFLEDWKEIPPFRKDFDTREYVKRRDHDRP